MLRDLGALSYGSVTGRESPTSRGRRGAPRRRAPGARGGSTARSSLDLGEPGGPARRAERGPASRCRQQVVGARGPDGSELGAWLPGPAPSTWSSASRAGEPRGRRAGRAEQRAQSCRDGVPAAGASSVARRRRGRARSGCVWLGPSADGDAGALPVRPSRSTERRAASGSAAPRCAPRRRGARREERRGLSLNVSGPTTSRARSTTAWLRRGGDEHAPRPVARGDRPRREAVAFV